MRSLSQRATQLIEEQAMSEEPDTTPRFAATTTSSWLWLSSAADSGARSLGGARFLPARPSHRVFYFAAGMQE